jgi:pectate lyase
MNGKQLLLLSVLLLMFSRESELQGQDVSSYLNREDGWFRTAGALSIGSNIVSHQSLTGAWPKNIDTSAAFSGERRRIVGTFDNGATVKELRFLARVLTQQTNSIFLEAYRKGFHHILQAQYPNGGWPQFHPPGTNYHRYITFNDQVMVRLLQFLQEAQKRHSFLNPDEREKAERAVRRGIDCILLAQIQLKGKKTGWAAQHDHLTLEPRPGRSFEPVALASAESVGVVRFLMAQENPSTEIKAAVEAAVEWLRGVELEGLRLEKISSLNGTREWVVVPDKFAGSLWARFYSMETQQPLFADRDGISKRSLAELSDERRNGYAWYGDWPAKLLREEYPAWVQRTKAEANGPLQPFR